MDYRRLRNELFKRTERYANGVRRLYDQALADIAKEFANMEYDPSRVFSFDEVGKFGRVDAIMTRLESQIQQVVEKGIVAEFGQAYNSCNELIRQVVGNRMNEEVAKAFMPRVLSGNAAKVFIKANRAGNITASQRVWNGAALGQMETAVEEGLMEGMPANRMAKLLEDYLVDPDSCFRRFRIKTGVDADGKSMYGRKWKKRIIHEDGSNTWKDADPRDYPVGSGVYHSSYRNALRYARTTTNIAYRTADYDRYQDLPFVIGIEIKTSGNHPESDICDELAGEYPKDFLWTGWHPNCRCYQVPILAKPDEVEKMTDAIMEGEDPEKVPVEGRITDVPDNFNAWVGKNMERIIDAQRLPYFLRDNGKKDAQGVWHVKEFTKYATMAQDVSTGEITYLPANFEKVFNEMSKDYVIRAMTNGEYNNLEEWLESVGLSISEAQNMLNHTIENSDVYMLIDGNILEKNILKQGENFKTLVETRKGTFATTEEKIQKRITKEQQVFGVSKDADFDEYPKYGFLSSKGQMGHKDIIEKWDYGDCVVRFDKNKVGGRASFTMHDSYDGNHCVSRDELISMIQGEKDKLKFYNDEQRKKIEDSIKVLESVLNSTQSDTIWIKSAPVSPLLEPRVQSLNPVIRKGLKDNLKSIDALNKSSSTYMECQLYGRVTIDDVSQIEVYSAKRKASIEKMLKKQNRDIPVVACNYDRRVSYLLEPVYDDIPLAYINGLRPTDISKLGDKIIESLYEKQKCNFKLAKEFPEELRAEATTLDEKRAYLESYYKCLQEGTLPKCRTKYYKKSYVGWLDDVLNTDLLKQ